MKTTIPSHLSDESLMTEVLRFSRSERDATAQLVAHLAELDARKLYLGAGFPSLFAYCCGALALSEHETYNRIEAARMARRFPIILDMLADGAVNLTTVRLLAPQLNVDNHEGLLAAASHKTKREVEELLVQRVPRPDVPASIRKVPAPRQLQTAPAAPAPAIRPAVAEVCAPPPAVARPLATPLAPARYEIRFTASAATYDKLRLAQDLLRHSLPNADPAEIVDRALTVLLEDLARKKFAATDRPRAGAATTIDSRHVPANVKRAVWLRDGGRCAFIGHGGRRCNARGFLEFHHVKPYAVGGEATVENIQLRCRAHNHHEADLYFAASRSGDGGGVFREARPRYGQLLDHATRSGTS
jgi:hypothetical protein